MENELYHHGIKGQKWGVRRFEDASGHLTPAGKARYGNSSSGSSGVTSTKKRGMSKTVKNHLKRAAKYAAIGVGTGLAAYGLSRYDDHVRNERYKKAEANNKAYSDLLKNLTERVRQKAKFADEARSRMNDFKARYGRYRQQKQQSSQQTESDEARTRKVANDKTHKRAQTATDRNWSYDDAKKVQSAAMDAYQNNPTKENLEKLRDAQVQLKLARQRHSADKAEQAVAKMSSSRRSASTRKQSTGDASSRSTRALPPAQKTSNKRSSPSPKTSARVATSSAQQNATRAKSAHQSTVDAAKSFRDSVEKARKAGVPESKILKDQKDIDEYFTGGSSSRKSKKGKKQRKWERTRSSKDFDDFMNSDERLVFE